MLMVIAGAGASYDSIPSRLPKLTSSDQSRPPLADALFESRTLFEEIQRELPQMMPITPLLQTRQAGLSVEDVLAGFASEAHSYPRRQVQLAAVRFYLRALVARCEELWYRSAPLPSNMMALLDQIDRLRGNRARPLLVTFNYDRIIEHALATSGQVFRSLDDYCRSDRPNLFKLHGSVDWVRPVAPVNVDEFTGGTWSVARRLIDEMPSLPSLGEIMWSDQPPGSRIGNALTVPAIAVPLKAKSNFECPPKHIDALRTMLPEVRTILTIGWRGAEEHFLKLLSEHCRRNSDVICVGGTVQDAEETTRNLSRALCDATTQAVGNGFTDFVARGAIERLLNITWL